MKNPLAFHLCLMELFTCGSRVLVDYQQAQIPSEESLSVMRLCVQMSLLATQSTQQEAQTALARINGLSAALQASIRSSLIGIVTTIPRFRSSSVSRQ